MTRLDKKKAPIENLEEVACNLTIWLLGKFSIPVSDRFDLARSTPHGVFMKVCYALASDIGKNAIPWPHGKHQAQVLEGFELEV